MVKTAPRSFGHRASNCASTARVPNRVVHDIMEVTYHDKLEEIDGFELSIGNWDAIGANTWLEGDESDKDPACANSKNCSNPATK